MEILYYKEVSSTQKELIALLKAKKVTPPVALYCGIQTNGVGSRGNSWIAKEGNLFLSVAIKKKQLPNDLKLESASIYFAYLLYELLQSMGSQVWLKWPNDFYLEEKKVGGMITNIVGESLVFGVGLNLVDAPEGFDRIDIKVTPKSLVEEFVKKMKNFPSWKQVFRKYSVEFYKNQSFTTHIDNKKVSLKDAILHEDGSITLNGERIFSLR